MLLLQLLQGLLLLQVGLLLLQLGLLLLLLLGPLRHLQGLLLLGLLRG